MAKDRIVFRHYEGWQTRIRRSPCCERPLERSCKLRSSECKAEIANDIAEEFTFHS